MSNNDEEPQSLGDGAAELATLNEQPEDPARFKREQWEAIVRNNSLLYGLVVNPNTGEVSRARKPGECLDGTTDARQNRPDNECSLPGDEDRFRERSVLQLHLRRLHHLRYGGTEPAPMVTDATLSQHKRS